jgi:hypothetical protein
MKKGIKFFALFSLALIPFEFLAQEINDKTLSDRENVSFVEHERKDNEVEIIENSIQLIETKNGVSTYAVINDKVRTKLFYDNDFRNFITALPGFVELGVSSGKTPMRVIIQEQYADGYLNQYFKTN